MSIARAPRIFLTGDTHGHIDSGRLIGSEAKKNRFRETDTLIILGDFGGVWYGGTRDEYLLDAYAELPCTVFFIDGNHENFDLLFKYPEVIQNGARCHQIRPNLFHVMRGEILDIAGKKLFCFGGAVSIDKAWRTTGKNWWHQEIPTQAEYDNAEKNLEAVNWKVDYVLTHCAPTLTLRRLNPRYIDDLITDQFESWDAVIDYKRWYFAHYHVDHKIDKKHICLYRTIEEVK